MIRAELPSWVEPGATFIAKRSHKFYDLESERAKVTIEEGAGYDAIEDVTWLVVEVHAGRASAEIANMLHTEEVWGVSANSVMVREAKDIASAGENDAFRAAARVVAQQHAQKKEEAAADHVREQAAFVRKTAARFYATAMIPLLIPSGARVETLSPDQAVDEAVNLLRVLEERGWGFK
jgi:hypothetical protein